MAETKPVYVLSTHEHDSSGGFFWFPAATPRDVLLAQFMMELDTYLESDLTSNEPHNQVDVKLVLMQVPAELNGRDLTEYIDTYALDWIESDAEPIVQATIPERKAP